MPWLPGKTLPAQLAALNLTQHWLISRLHFNNSSPVLIFSQPPAVLDLPIRDKSSGSDPAPPRNQIWPKFPLQGHKRAPMEFFSPREPVDKNSFSVYIHRSSHIQRFDSNSRNPLPFPRKEPQPLPPRGGKWLFSNQTFPGRSFLQLITHPVVDWGKPFPPALPLPIAPGLGRAEEQAGKEVTLLRRIALPSFN